MSIGPGNRAPEFNLPTDGGGTLASKGLKGKKVVLYFYPKDMTSGCTKESIAFAEASPTFEQTGVTIVGISKDSIARHDKFKAKHDLPFTLLSDTDGTLCEAYGVWVEKSLYGRKYMGIERATFLIDEKGVVRKTWRKVKVSGHVEAVLEAARKL